MCERILRPDFPADSFVNAAIKLCRLEEKLGKPYEEALKNLERELKEKSTRLGELNSKVGALEGKKARLENELRELEAKHTSARTKLTELTRGVESLEKLGTDKICKLSTFGRECEELSYSIDKLMELVRLVNRKTSLERQTSTLQKRITTLNQEIKRVERERLAMIAENRSLLTASGILKSRTTSIACAYCGKPIFVLVPNIWELEDSMKKRLVYPARCHNCGYTNYINPQDILASIAWKILTA